MRHDVIRQTAGRKSQPPRYSFATDRYDQFQVIYVSTGRLIMTVNDQDIPIDPGGIALLRVSSRFRLRTEAKGYSGVFYSAYNDPTPKLAGPAAV